MKKTKRNLFIGLTAAVILLFALSACDTSSGDGVVELSITDSPLMTDDVHGVYITIVGIQYHTTNDNWESVNNFGDPQTFDLLALTRGDSRLLGELILPAGNYTQIRFMLGAPDYADAAPASPGSWIEKGADNDGEFTDGVDEPLFVPSGAQTGYKAMVDDGFFSVPINGSVEITADFDLRRAVVEAGSSGKYILKPVLRLVVNDQAGEISGNIMGTTALEPGNTYVVYAYQSDTYDVSESADPVNDEPRFPNAVTSSKLIHLADEDDYVLAFLAEGTYALYGAEYDADGEFLGVTSLFDNVAVTAGETSTNNLEDVAWD